MMTIVLLQRFIESLLFGLSLLVTISVGTLISRRMATFGISRLEAFSLSLGIGLVVIAYGVLFIGLLGWLHRTVLILWLAICFASGIPAVWQEIRWGRFSKTFSEKWAELSLIEKVWSFLVVSLNLLAFMVCFVPPWVMEWDSLSYHLSAPKLYWMEGRIYPVEFMHHAHFPSTAQMLYLFALGLTNLKSSVIAKLFHWSFFVLCQLTLLCFGTALPKRSLRVGLLTVVAFVSIPIVFWEATVAYNDLALTAFALLTLYCVVKFAQQPDRRWLIWAGVFAGASAGTKYTGGLCVLLALILAFVAMSKQKAFDGRALALSFIVAVVVAMPWYVKNWLWTGNPVFPFAYSIFDGRNWTEKMAHDYTVSNKEFGSGRDLTSLLLMPFHLTLNEVRWGQCGGQWLGIAPQKFHFHKKCGHFDNFDAPQLSIGVLPLILIPTVIVLAVFETIPFAVSASIWAILAWFAWWFMEAQYLRYLLPALGWSCIIIGYTAARLSEVNFGMRWVVRLTFTLALAYAILIAIWQSVSLLPVSFGVIKEEDFLRETTTVYKTAEFVNRLAINSVIATYGEPLGYYFDRKYFWADSGHNRLIYYERLKTADDLIKEFQRLKVTHIVVNWRYVPRQSLVGKWITEALQERKLKLLFQTGTEEVLELKPQKHR